MGLEGLELGRVHEEKLESIFGQLIGKGGGLSGRKSSCPRENQPSTKTLIFSIYARD